MEQHPVPQNVIDVEFKLFGAFSLRQFSKILFGSLFALIVYAIGIPDIIKYPVMIISVLVGIGLAIVPNLGVWINGLLKSIFMAPRYVWVKETRPPEILQENFKATAENLQKVSSLESKKKINIEEIPFGRMFAARQAEGMPAQTEAIKKQVQKDDLDEPEANFGEVYEDVFGKDIFKRPANSVLNSMVNTPTKTNQPVQPIKPNLDFSQVTFEDLKAEMSRLKIELSSLNKANKNDDARASEQEVMSKINDIYREIKIREDKSKSLTSTGDLTVGKVRVPQSNLGSQIMGIVVDKSDNPISNVIISLTGEQGEGNFSSITSTAGKFSTAQKLPLGKYKVTLQDNKHRFHVYELEVKDGSSPAYKFRER